MRACYKTGVMAIEVLHCGNKNFGLFGSCDLDLDLDPMTFIYELDPYCRGVCEYELRTSRLSKVIVRETDTCIRTGRIDHKARRLAGAQ